MMLSTTFNNISVLSWRWVLLVENTGETHRPDTTHWQTSHILYRVHVAWPGFELTTLVVIGTDCTYRCIPYDHDYDCPLCAAWC